MLEETPKFGDEKKFSKTISSHYGSKEIKDIVCTFSGSKEDSGACFRCAHLFSDGMWKGIISEINSMTGYPVARMLKICPECGLENT